MMFLIHCCVSAVCAQRRGKEENSTETAPSGQRAAHAGSCQGLFAGWLPERTPAGMPPLPILAPPRSSASLPHLESLDLSHCVFDHGSGWLLRTLAEGAAATLTSLRAAGARPCEAEAQADLSFLPSLGALQDLDLDGAWV